MSVQAITIALKLQGVTASEKLVLFVLANYADEAMRSFASMRKLSLDTSMSERTVQRTIKVLEDRGLLSRVARVRPDGSRSTDIITLHLDGGDKVTGGGDTVAPGGVNDDGGVVSQGQGGGVMVSPLTTFEPSLEPSEEPSNTTRAFDAFWREYPEKVGKGAARIAYSKALKRIGTQNAEAVILEGVRAANEQSDKWRRGIVPNPATWLNQDRWNDEHRPQPDPRHAPPSAKIIERHANYGRALSGFEAVAFARADDG